MTDRSSRLERGIVRLPWVPLFLCIAALLAAFGASCTSAQRSHGSIENAAYRLTIDSNSGGLHAVLEDKRSGLRLADGPMVYRTDAAGHENPTALFQLVDPAVSVEGRKLTIRGTLAGLRVEHAYALPPDKPVMDETLLLTNTTGAVVALPDFECGLTRVLKDENGGLPADLKDDRFVAVPHRKRAEAAKETFLDFSSGDMADKPGFEASPDQVQDPHYLPSRHRSSDGWAWTHGGYALGIYKYSQEAMLFSVLSTAKTGGRTLLRFGGTAVIMGEPAILTRLKPGETADLGLTRYETYDGGYREAMYGYRRLLDERGCRFPASYDPPVHWEQLYDMEGAWDHRATQYTKAIIEREAQKGVDYSCEAIYLDPGWDTKFASFIWGEKWLGPMDAFVTEMRDRYGLKVSLHTPLATWMSLDIPMGPPSIDTWPAEARLAAPPAPAPQPGAKPAVRRLPAICLGSRQYLDAAEKRLLDLCAAGATFLMYDGNFWNGGCLDPNHGHPVPYTYEDHIRANVDLAQRIHAKYPHVLIEMHDMIAGGNPVRDTPLYYTYGLPGSWDENWGYELMWDSMADIKTLRCLSLYYSDLSCNIPFYLHVNLRGDNTDAVVLWWYASTCRHLGIGGTDKNPAVVAAQKAAMKRYHAVEALYKRGEFYGISEELHVHVLGDRVAVNAFNLNDKARTIAGSIGLSELGLKPDGPYVFDEPWVRAENGKLVVKADIGPWGAKMSSAAGLDIVSVTPGRAFELVKEPRTFLVDVRSVAEYVLIGHPEMAYSVPITFWSEDGAKFVANPDFLTDLEARFAKDDSLIFICRSGGRSRTAAREAAKEGFIKVSHISEGFEGDLDGKGHRTVGGWKNSLPYTYKVDPMRAYGKAATRRDERTG